MVFNFIVIKFWRFSIYFFSCLSISFLRSFFETEGFVRSLSCIFCFLFVYFSFFSFYILGLLSFGSQPQLLLLPLFFPFIIFLRLHLSITLCLSIYQSTYLSINLSIYQSTYLYFSIYPSIYRSNTASRLHTTECSFCMLGQSNTQHTPFSPKQAVQGAAPDTLLSVTPNHLSIKKDQCHLFTVRINGLFLRIAIFGIFLILCIFLNLNRSLW